MAGCEACCHCYKIVIGKTDYESLRCGLNGKFVEKYGHTCRFWNDKRLLEL